MNKDLARACLRAINNDYACEIRAGRNDVTKPACGGRSILEMIWEKLGEVMAQLMVEGATQQYSNGVLRGQALGLATAIAIITNPYNPDVDMVRQEAVRRWEEGQA